MTADISTSIVDNLIKVMSVVAQNSLHNASGIADLHGSLRYFTGCEFAFFNGLFNNDNHHEKVILDNLEKTTAFFAAKEVPFVWWWTQQSEIPAEIKTTLDKNGFHFLGDYLGIAAKLNEIKFNSIDDQIEVRRVNNEQEYELLLNVMCEVFQLSESIKADIKVMYNSYGPQGKFRHYLGYYEGKPAATLTSYMDGEIVGFYSGATLAQFQKQGLCSALADYAIKDAMSLGCQYGVAQLMTPGMAKGLSEKMGFQTYCRLLPFLKDPRV